MNAVFLSRPLEPMDLVLKHTIPVWPEWALQPGTEGRTTWYSRVMNLVVRIDDDQAAQTVSMVVLDPAQPMTVRHIPWRVYASERYLVPETAPTLVDSYAADGERLAKTLANSKSRRLVFTDSL